MRRTTKLVVFALTAVVAVAFLAVVLHYVPFSAPSDLAWAGSAIIRRVWLDAIVDRAVQRAEAS